MATNDDEVRPKSVFVYALTDEEEEEWMLSMAGDDPARRAAVLKWRAIKGVHLDDRHEDRIVEILYERAQLQLEDLQRITLFPEIRSVRFVSTRVNDEMLRLLGTHWTLQELAIVDEPDVGDLALEIAAQLPNLWRLSIDGCGISDEGVAHLASHKRLILLYLVNSELTSAIGRHIASIQQLRHLGLDGTSVGDECLGHLKNLVELESLRLKDTEVTNNGIKELSSLKRLRTLSLENTRIDNEAIGIVDCFTELYNLLLDGTQITNDAIARLVKLSKLGNLSLRDTAIDDGCVPDLAKMGQLTSLDIRGTRISREGASRIQASLRYQIKSDHGRLK